MRMIGVGRIPIGSGPLPRRTRDGLSLRTLLAVAAVALAAASLTPSSARASGFISTAGCQEHQGFMDGDAAAVRARLPKRFSAELDPTSGRPLLFARAIHCDKLTIDGHTGPATMGSFGIVIQSPDGRGCGSGVPAVGAVAGDQPPICNWYPLFWVANEPRVVGWLRDGTPDFPAVFTPNLAFDLGALDPAKGGAPFQFQAFAPTPSPFTMDDIGRERPGAISIRGGYWADTPRGPVKIAFSTDDLTSGDATGDVHAAHGSEMATLMGTDQATYLPGLSNFAAERWSHASYRKQTLAPANNSDSFAGSCSLQGQVAFTPPATNNDAALAYRYDASGTCTGTLDGTRISGAPVTLHHTGTLYGSCLRDQTTAPGDGTIIFPGGAVVRYTLDFTTTGGEVDATLYGEHSGTARAQGTFLTQRTPPDVAAKCSGDGLAASPMDLSLTTDSPLTSERPSPHRTGTPSAHNGASVKFLRLVVSPRRARLGRPTRFTVRVTTNGHVPVPGALVRFAGRRVHTGRAGTARIAATFHRAGRHSGRAKAPGFHTARAAIRVLRP